MDMLFQIIPIFFQSFTARLKSCPDTRIPRDRQTLLPAGAAIQSIISLTTEKLAHFEVSKHDAVFAENFHFKPGAMIA